MQRLLTAAAAVAACTLTAAAAHAEIGADQGLSVAVSKAQLTSATGYVDLKQQIAARADAYCRAHPIGLTVATCTRDIAAALESQAAAQRQALLARQNSYAQAQR